jgi:hypothetical protein
VRKLTLTLIIALTLACALTLGPSRLFAQQNPGRLTPAEARGVIAARAAQVMLAIKQGDMRRLSTFVHPRKGVRFSPYVYVGPEDRIFYRQAVRNFATDRRRYLWGEMDESERKIRLTPGQYFKQFVYDRDFLSAKEVNYNTQKQRGNTISNVMETYPRAVAVEYYLPGTDDELYGALWLVFERAGPEWYLVGIVRDTWTI